MQLRYSVCLMTTYMKGSSILVTDSNDDRTLADNITKNSGKGKNKSAKLEVRPFMVKNYLWVFVNSMITNPTFDSQVCCCTCRLCRTAAYIALVHVHTVWHEPHCSILQYTCCSIRCCRCTSSCMFVQPTVCKIWSACTSLFSSAVGQQVFWCKLIYCT